MSAAIHVFVIGLAALISFAIVSTTYDDSVLAIAVVDHSLEWSETPDNALFTAVRCENWDWPDQASIRAQKSYEDIQPPDFQAGSSFDAYFPSDVEACGGTDGYSMDDIKQYWSYWHPWQNVWWSKNNNYIKDPLGIESGALGGKFGEHPASSRHSTSPN